MIRSLFFFCALSALAQDGAALYKARCAGCHDALSGRVPTFSALRAMNPASIWLSLESGLMKTQAEGLTTADRFALIGFIAAPAPTTAAPAPPTSSCTTKFQPASNAAWLGWGANLSNTRFQNQAEAGIAAADVPKLKLKWAFGLGAGTTVRSQPAVGDGRLFVADLNGQVYSLDSQTGCILWTFNPGAKLHTAIAFEKSAKASAIYFGDEQANTYALDAASGALLWKTHVADHFAALLTGTPQLHDGVLYVPVASYEELLAASPAYECCTFRGSLVALDAATGKCLWKAYSIPEPPPAKDASSKTHGPSGAGIWSAPTFDEKLNVLYVATGDNYSDPATATSDAVLAIDAKTGKLLWSKQATPNDVYNMGANAKGRDFDFGQSPILTSLPSGKRALVIGQKSAVVYALDPDNRGEILWQTPIGHGGPLGGIMWGSAADPENMYVALSDLIMTGVPDKSTPQGYRLELDPKQGGGLFALRLTNGEKVWTAKPADCGERKNCSPAQPAAITAISGVVLSGSLDGHLRAFSTATGAIVWDFDTVQDYNTVNGQKARGGSLDVAGPVIAGGMLYVNSGYGQWGGMPGNVVLAFSVDGK